MSYTSKIVYISLAASLCLSLIVYLLETNYRQGFYFSEVLIGAAVISLGEVALLLLIGLGFLIIKPKLSTPSKAQGAEVLDAPQKKVNYKERARSFFLAAGLVLLIGVSLCFGGFMGPFS